MLISRHFIRGYSKVIVALLGYFLMYELLSMPLAHGNGTTAYKKSGMVKENQEIIALCLQVDEAIERHELKKTCQKFDYCRPYIDNTRIKYEDEHNVVRKYITEGGSDDSMLVREHYYDFVGHIRFVRIKGGAANGTRIEHRIYFDMDGKRINEIQKRLEGPGYTFPSVWPEEDIATNPKERFSSENPCKKSNCEEP